MTLTSEDVEAIARRVAELVSPPSGFSLVDAAQLAAELGVSTDYVYAHANELGAMRLGDGPKARMRFDIETARRALEARRKQTVGRTRKASRNRR